MVWMQLILCAVYRQTVFSPDGSYHRCYLKLLLLKKTLHLQPHRLHLQSSFKFQSDSMSSGPRKDTAYLVAATNARKLQSIWRTLTVEIEHTAPLPSRSTVKRINHEPSPKRMVWMQLILCAVNRNTVLSPDGRYHRRCPTIIKYS